MLLQWIDGQKAEKVIPTISENEQYRFSIESGKILKQIHSAGVWRNVGNWSDRYFSTIDERIGAFKNENVRFDGNEVILSFIESNRTLLKKRLQCFHHGNYHIGKCTHRTNSYILLTGIALILIIMETHSMNLTE